MRLPEGPARWLFVGPAAIVLAIGGAYYLSRRERNIPAEKAIAQKTPQEVFKEIEEQLKKRDEALLSSQWAKLLIRKDFIEITSVVNTPKTERDRGDFFDSLNRLTERKLLKDYNEEELNRLTRIVTNFVYDNRSEFIGHKARAITRAMRALARLPQPARGSEEERKLLSIAELDEPEQFRFLGLELTAGWKTAPRQTLSTISKGFRSKSLHVVNASLQLFSSINDPKAKKAALAELAKAYPKMSEELRPLAMKLVITYRNLLDDDDRAGVDRRTRELVGTSSEIWRDVFLYALETSGDVRGYEAELQRLGAVKDPLLNERIRNLLMKTRAPAGEKKTEK